MKKIIFFSGILPILFGIISLFFLPDIVSIHYDAYRNIDRYGSKFEILIFPFSIFAISLFWLFVIRYYQQKLLLCDDTEKEKYNKNIIIIEKLAICINIANNFMNIYFILIAGNYMSTRYINLFTGILILFLIILIILFYSYSTR